MCGSDIYVKRGCRRIGVDDLDAFYPESNDHRCEPNRIRREEGYEAYQAYQAVKNAEYEAEVLRKYPTFEDARRDAERQLRALGKRPRERRRRRASKLKLAQLLSGIFNPDVVDYSDEDLLVWFLTDRRHD